MIKVRYYSSYSLHNSKTQIRLNDDKKYYMKELFGLKMFLEDPYIYTLMLSQIFK